MTMLMEAKRTSDRVTGFSNVTFDLLSILERKLQGIAAMEEYKIDCRDEGDHEALELIEQMEHVAATDVSKLRALLRDRL
jgi:hypothetical protein